MTIRIQIRILLIAFLMITGISCVSMAETESTVKGTMRLYLYQQGTGLVSGGVNDIKASLGDTISVEAFILNSQRNQVTGLEIYLTVDDRYFDIVHQGEYIDGTFQPYENDDGSFQPFIKGNFMVPAGNPNPFNPVGNYTHGDSLTANDNSETGWQMDYAILSPQNTGQGRPYTNFTFGTACTFQLIAIAPCDSSIVSIDVDRARNRATSYLKDDSPDNFSFATKTSCYLSVSGIEINPPLPDLIMNAGSTNTSIDLDDHIGISSIPTSEFVWNATGNSSIVVYIDPDTHVVTFTVPPGFKGYEDITFTVTGKSGDTVGSSDTMRITVDEPPAFIDSAIPETITIHEDSLMAALALRDIVSDPDDDFEDLIWTFAYGENLTHSVVADTLFLKGAQDFFGGDALEITVTDSYDLSDTVIVPVQVLPINDAPVLTELPDVTVERNESHQLDFGKYAVDVDGDELTVNWVTSENFIISANGLNVSISGAPGFLGSEELTFTVSDPDLLESSDSMGITVTKAKKPPVWSTLPKIGFAQNKSDSTLVLWDFVSDPDDPDSLLTFAVENKDDVDFSDVNYRNGKLYLFDIDNTAGFDNLTISAYDPDGNFSSTELRVFVAPADGTPIVAGLPDTTMVAGTMSNWIDLDDYYYDIDNEDFEMNWSWGRLANADSSATVNIDVRSHVVRLSSISEFLFGADKLFFSVVDPGGKTGDDVCDVVILEDLTKPVINLPAKIGFIAGEFATLDLDDYSSDPSYENSELAWTWAGNLESLIALETPDEINTRPVSFSGSAEWIGWERIQFTVINPLGGSIQDTLTVFSVTPDGLPLAGGLTGLSIKAGECRTLNMDDYFYDADSPDYAVTWEVAGNDSVTVSIDPLSHSASVCALSETWQGQENLTFTVTDQDGNTDTMDVTIIVTDAVLRNVLTADIFRNPMQEDYMDFFITGNLTLKGIPGIRVIAGADTTDVAVGAIAVDYFYGKYVLPYNVSIGEEGIATAILSGSTTDGRTVQDSTRFAYGKIASLGGKIALDAISLDIPAGALEKPVNVTIIPSDDHDTTAKKAWSEIEFEDYSYTVGPVSLHGELPFTLAYEVDSDVAGAGIYRKTNGSWAFAGADRDEKSVSALIDGGGTFRLGFDTIAPGLREINSDDGTIAIAVTDFGSGVETETMSVMFEGDVIPFAFDSDASALLIDLTAFEAPGDLSFEVSVSDRSGNRSETTFSADLSAIPGQIYLEQNHPNPFNPITNISFTITSDEHVSVDIYDSLGRKVRVLADDRYTSGRHTFIWNARDDMDREVSSGVYLYRVVAGSHTITRKMLFLQ